MADETKPVDSAADPDPDRRKFLSRLSGAAMAAGLVGGYGAFGSVAARFLYPEPGRDRAWFFVTDIASTQVGESLLYRAPSGESVAVTRQGAAGNAEDFIALSSTCPHLGCQVTWEPHNDRYFCPCHNGTFDAAGKGTGGPPGDAGQSLLRYPLKVENGLLYIEVSSSRLAEDARGEIIERVAEVEGPGHDPCLAPQARRGDRKA